MFNVHGTYPMDGGKWRIVAPTPERRDACDYLTVDDVRSFLDFVGPLSADYYQGEEDRWGPKRYLFVNKGYVVLGGDGGPVDGSSDALAFAFLEQLTEGEVGRPWPKGTRAVYVHDGRYMLIERR